MSYEKEFEKITLKEFINCLSPEGRKIVLKALEDCANISKEVTSKRYPQSQLLRW